MCVPNKAFVEETFLDNTCYLYLSLSSLHGDTQKPMAKLYNIHTINSMPAAWKKKPQKTYPPLPSEHRGWNTGKGDCGHYRSQLGFSILMGRGFIQGARVFKGGTWALPKAILPGPCW